jgi:DNA-binding NtrC family response regulator
MNPHGFQGAGNMPDPKTILAIEDEKNQLLLFREVLEEEGYAVLTCPNILAAMEILEKNPVDLILTDVKLPGGDATGFIAQLRETHLNIPIVVVSGYTAYGDYLERHEPMVKAFFKKPVDMKQLKLTIAEILQQVPVTREA